MGNSKFFEKFDDETLLKLEIFEEYLKAFISISVKGREKKKIYIFDLFCGPGKDKNGNLGSPLIILKTLEKLHRKKNDWFNNIKIQLFFNDKNTNHIFELKEKIKEISSFKFLKINTSSFSFNEFIKENQNKLESYSIPKLLFLDQFGIKHVPLKELSSILSVKNTDILTFFPSSQVNRFKNRIGENILGINDNELEELGKDFNRVHSNLAKLIRKKISKSSNKKVYVVPFSIKKGSNINGLIFCCSSLLALQKFLNACWKIDPKNGEANYNISKDSDYKHGEKGTTMYLDKSFVEPFTKLRDFTNNLFDFIKKKKRTNKEVYIFSLENGFPPNQMKEVVDNLKERGLVILKKDGEKARKNARYLAHKYYKKEEEAYYFIEDKNG